MAIFFTLSPAATLGIEGDVGRFDGLFVVRDHSLGEGGVGIVERRARVVVSFVAWSRAVVKLQAFDWSSCRRRTPRRVRGADEGKSSESGSS